MWKAGVSEKLQEVKCASEENNFLTFVATCRVGYLVMKKIPPFHCSTQLGVSRYQGHDRTASSNKYNVSHIQAKSETIHHRICSQDNSELFFVLCSKFGVYYTLCRFQFLLALFQVLCKHILLVAVTPDK